MSLAEVQEGENAEFNECTSEYSHNTQYTHVNVERGCISLFNNDISKYSMSSMITFCGCEMIGPKQYDFVSLQNAGLVSKAGAGLISYIATGKDTSITIYNTPDFTGDEGAHTVIGPETQSPASRIKRAEQHWDNAIYSLVLQAWNSCEEEEEIVCSPVTTAPQFLHLRCHLSFNLLQGLPVRPLLDQLPSHQKLHYWTNTASKSKTYDGTFGETYPFPYNGSY